MCLAAGVACGGGERSAGTAAKAEVPAGMPHGDHSPHHGGIVMMKGDLHYEVILDAAGRYRLYFTDAGRADLPASTAANASITILRPGAAPEGIALRIDEAGESWIGQGAPVADPDKTTARVSYTLRGEEPYWIDLPFTLKESAEEHSGR